MNAESNRSYRKHLITSGLIYMNGEEQQVSVVNISMTGMLVQLSPENSYSEVFDDSLSPTIIDFYLPQLRLAGTAEIVRANKEEQGISLALRFKDMSYNIDNLLYKRKVYRKNIAITGKILLNAVCYRFQTINVSVEGLMISLPKKVELTAGMIARFEFKNLNIGGEAEVVWSDINDEGHSVVGLKYLHINTDKIMGIPRFSME